MLQGYQFKGFFFFFFVKYIGRGGFELQHMYYVNISNHLKKKKKSSHLQPIDQLTKLVINLPNICTCVICTHHRKLAILPFLPSLLLLLLWEFYAYLVSVWLPCFRQIITFFFFSINDSRVYLYRIMLYNGMEKRRETFQQ